MGPGPILPFQSRLNKAALTDLTCACRTKVEETPNLTAVPLHAGNKRRPCQLPIRKTKRDKRSSFRGSTKLTTPLICAIVRHRRNPLCSPFCTNNRWQPVARGRVWSLLHGQPIFCDRLREVAMDC